MTLALTTSFILVLSLMLMTIVQPLLFGLVMIILVSLLSLTIALSFSSWYAYTMFIIFVGGLLVMFAYVSALIPNDLFFPPNFSNYMQMLMILFSLSFLLFQYFSPTALLSSPAWAVSMKSATNLFLFSNYSLLLLLILVLLFILTLVVKICSIQFGPLRPFNYLFSMEVPLPSKQKA